MTHNNMNHQLLNKLVEFMPASFFKAIKRAHKILRYSDNSTFHKRLFIKHIYSQLKLTQSAVNRGK